MTDGACNRPVRSTVLQCGAWVHNSTFNLSRVSGLEKPRWRTSTANLICDQPHKVMWARGANIRIGKFYIAHKSWRTQSALYFAAVLHLFWNIDFDNLFIYLINLDSFDFVQPSLPATWPIYCDAFPLEMRQGRWKCVQVGLVAHGPCTPILTCSLVPHVSNAL